MSLLANSTQSTQGSSWAEDFVDLSEFCQNTSTITRMEDLVDENSISPISNTVHDHGFEFLLNCSNKKLPNNFGGDTWYTESPMTMQEELCNPFTDWLNDTTNGNNCNANDNNLDNIMLNKDLLLTTTTTSDVDVDDPNNLPSFDNLPTSYGAVIFSAHDDCSPPSQPDSTFILKNDEMVDNGGISNYTSVVDPQSPSITQSTGGDVLVVKSPGLPARRESKLKLKIGECEIFTPCSMNTPEVLKPLGDNSGFDLVSYVIDQEKKAFSLDTPVDSLIDVEPLCVTQVIIKQEPSDDVPHNQHVPIQEKKTRGILKNHKIKYEEMEEEYSGGRRKRENHDWDFIEAKFMKRGRKVSEESVEIPEKYKELRYRNNEASRRSRANRKSREVEMNEQLAKLELDNKILKMKSEEMQGLVTRLRGCLMQIVLGRR